jgi:putative protease
MSAVVGGRSANRGMCAQPCRLPCSVKKGREDYTLSLKDMSHLDFIRELESFGVDSFKIEGRMKRPEYSALCASCAVKALDGESYDRDLLCSVFSRGGFTDGYLTGKTGAQMFGRRTKEDAKNATAAYPKIHEIYRREYKRGRLDFFVTLKRGEPLKIAATDENGLYAEFVGALPESAQNRPCDEDYIKKQLSKLGGTFYSAGEFSCEIEAGLAVPSAALNSARREITDKMSSLREEYFSRSVPFDNSALDLDFGKRKRTEDFKIRVCAVRAEQLEKLHENVEIAFLPLKINEIKKALEFMPAEHIGVAIPRFTFDENRDISQLKEIAALGIGHLLCTNFAHIVIAKRLCLTPHAGAGLNTSNLARLTR